MLHMVLISKVDNLNQDIVKQLGVSILLKEAPFSAQDDALLMKADVVEAVNN